MNVNLQLYINTVADQCRSCQVTFYCPYIGFLNIVTAAAYYFAYSYSLSAPL